MASRGLALMRLRLEKPPHPFEAEARNRYHPLPLCRVCGEREYHRIHRVAAAAAEGEVGS